MRKTYKMKVFVVLASCQTSSKPYYSKTWRLSQQLSPWVVTEARHQFTFQTLKRLCVCFVWVWVVCGKSPSEGPGLHFNTQRATWPLTKENSEKLKISLALRESRARWILQIKLYGFNCPREDQRASNCFQC